MDPHFVKRYFCAIGDLFIDICKSYNTKDVCSNSHYHICLDTYHWKIISDKRIEKIGYTIAGSLSGFLNSSISMSGPPVALFLSNQGADKNEFRANITIYAIILNVFTIATYLYNGRITKKIIKNSVWLIPAMIVGVIVGIISLKKLNEKTFKRIALLLIIFSGSWTLINAILSIGL